MNWNPEMTEAYAVGVSDGVAGKRRGRPNDFEACYEQGWQDGKHKRVGDALSAYAAAQNNMREYLSQVKQ